MYQISVFETLAVMLRVWCARLRKQNVLRHLLVGKANISSFFSNRNYTVDLPSKYAEKEGASE